jgi:hypothetical protein
MMLFKGSLVLTLFLLSVLTKAQSRELKMTTCSVGLLREGWKPWQQCGYTGAFAATGLITAGLSIHSYIHQLGWLW